VSTARIDLGPLPTVAASVLLEYRKPNERATFRLGETTQSVSEWEINESGTVELIATVRDKTGRLHRPGTTAAWSPQEAISPEPLPKDVTTWPGPVVTQDGPALSLTADVAPGLDPTDYQMEFRQGEDSGAAKDGLQLGFVAPNQEMKAFAWNTDTGPGNQTIHVRAHRLEDGRMSDWTTATYDTPTPILDPGTGHSNDFASGTLVATDGNITPLEINGGDLRQVAIYAGDVDGATNYAGDFTDIFAGDARLYWSPARYITASVTVSPVEDLVFQVYPNLTATTRKSTLYAGDCHWPAALPRFQSEDGSYHDPRVFECSLQNGADETPMVMEYEVNVNSGGYEKLIPGKPYSAVSSYLIRFTIKTFLEKQFTIDNLYCRHWIWCRARPWHSHSDAFELIHENTIAGAAVATYDISSINGDDFDELMLQVLWKNDNVGATNLWLRPNNDSGANYDSDGGGGNKIIIGGGNTVAQNEWEDVRVRIHNPAQGVQRAFSIESNARWTATASDSSDAQESWLWTDTANEIATIRVLTAGGATTHLAVGTTTRLWGKRHHTE
jgi:hypothetical protein